MSLFNQHFQVTFKPPATNSYARLIASDSSFFPLKRKIMKIKCSYISTRCKHRCFNLQAPSRQKTARVLDILDIQIYLLACGRGQRTLLLMQRIQEGESVGSRRERRWGAALEWHSSARGHNPAEESSRQLCLKYV